MAIRDTEYFLETCCGPIATSSVTSGVGGAVHRACLPYGGDGTWNAAHHASLSSSPPSTYPTTLLALLQLFATTLLHDYGAAFRTKPPCRCG